MWRFSQTPEQCLKNMVVTGFRILGPLDVEIFRDCLNYIERRHEILRTTYPVVDGQPRQIIHPPGHLPLTFMDLSDAAEPEKELSFYSKNDDFLSMDLARGPLMRFRLFRLRKDEYWLSRALHHIIWDGASGELFFQELALLYEAKLRGEDFPLPEQEPLQYGDYAVWHRQVFASEFAEYEEAVEWWERTLSRAPPVIKLPFLRDAPVQALAPSEGVMTRGFGAQESQRLKALGRMEGATPYMVRLAAFVALLAAETGKTDIVLGSYVSNRNLTPLQKMFGVFVNLTTLRFCFEPEKTFREWIAVVRRTVLETELRGEIPYEELCDQLRQRNVTPPEIRAIVGMMTTLDFREFGGLRMQYRGFNETMPWGFSLNFDEFDDERAFRVRFDACIYDPAGVRELLDQFIRLLATVLREPDLPLIKLLAMNG